MHKATYEENIKSVTELEEMIKKEERRQAHELEMESKKRTQPWKKKKKEKWEK